MGAKRRAKLFLSHSSHDKVAVNILVARMREAGVPTLWYDILELDALTQNLRNAIETGIEQADYFAIVLSPASVDSHWVTFEIDTALRMEKPVLALLNGPEQDLHKFLNNPHIERLLQGGQRKIVQLTPDIDAAITKILLAIAPKIGRKRAVEQALKAILEADDPDIADREASAAALVDTDSLLNGLIAQLPELRNDRRIRYRITRAITLIGERALPHILRCLFVEAPGSATGPTPPSALMRAQEEDLVAVAGRDAVDALRWLILTGNQKWSAKLGAEYCLIGLAQSSPSARRLVLRHLQEMLTRAISFIVEHRDEDGFTDDFYDSLRLAIETIGLIADQTAPADSFLLHEFASPSLWGEEAREAKYKLISYIVTALGRVASQDAVESLFALADDEDIYRIYFVQHTSPNPFLDCFVPRGRSVVEQLASRLRDEISQWTICLLHNLSKIQSPDAARAVLDRLDDVAEAGWPEYVPILVRNIARTEVAPSCDRIVTDYLNHRLISGLPNDRWEELQAGVALAAISASSVNNVHDICRELAIVNHPMVRLEVIDAIGIRQIYQLFDTVKDWFETGSDPFLRSRAALALARGRAIDSEAVLAKLRFAEEDVEGPQLSLALAQLGLANAIPGLIHGLQMTYLQAIEDRHEEYAASLRGLGTSEANEALQKWYKRI